MITIKTPPDTRRIWRIFAYYGHLHVYVYESCHNDYTLRTVSGFMQTGPIHMGDHECLNVDVDGDFVSSTSISSAGIAGCPTALSVRCNSETLYGLWIDLDTINDGEWHHFELGYLWGSETKYYWRCKVEDFNSYNGGLTLRDTGPCEDPDVNPPWGSRCGTFWPRDRLRFVQGERVNDLGVGGFWIKQLTEYHCNQIAYELSKGAIQPEGWGDLDMRAVQGTRAININTLMYVKELFEMGQMVRSTFDTLLDIKNGNVKDLVKGASSLYLSYHYGYRLSYKDTKELYEVAQKEWKRSCSPGRTVAATRERARADYVYPDATPLAGCNGTCTMSTKIWYRQLPNGLANAINSMFRWDVFPELGNVYDLIPYSFVVDWFIPFGDILDIIDTHTYASTLSVLGVLRSEKLTCNDVPPSNSLVRSYVGDAQALGPITFKYYRRFWEQEISYPPLQLSFQAGPKNWLPAGALILQRI